MLDELRELYQEVILDHGKAPRNFRAVENAGCSAAGNNPMCGDTLVLYLTVDEGGVIRDAAFQGQGCAISVSSASIMTELLKDKTADEAKALFQVFHKMCTEDDYTPPEDADEDALERLNVLAGVKTFPMRVKCATLAWHTMDAALSGRSEISTE
ncbi:MAG: Fe-S cluster assembly sulfur transfer protein SufU [Rhodospirillales bacterium]